ncbi:MAG: glycosyltransferase family 2 protein [Anaerolineae bacterium]|jgi:undecaprenyl-phosphate 4-deoxy-4-formamido-L-arabinose transferase|nr:glycosyltransferase family 2 protein [Anaerolineae bacterium]
MLSSLSVVIPVYNGALSIGALVEQLHVTLPALADRFEVILVEDDGKDNSWTVITGLAAQYPATLRAFKMSRNYGQHNALLCGLRAATGEIIITMDDDLQHPPDQIAPLLEKLAAGFDVVYGKPQNERHGLFRDMASQVTKWVLQNGMGAETAGSISAFRALRRHVVQAFAHYSGPTVNLDVLLTWGTSRFAAIPVRHEARTLGVSNYTFGKLVNHTLNMVTGFSTMPLRIASLLGFVMTVFGFLVLVYVIGRYFIEGGSVPGFPFLASVIAIFSGAQMFMIGIIGEYLARMYFRSMARPTYVVRESLGAPDMGDGNGQ